jgi:hypothetical protein
MNERMNERTTKQRTNDPGTDLQREEDGDAEEGCEDGAKYLADDEEPNRDPVGVNLTGGQNRSETGNHLKGVSGPHHAHPYSMPYTRLSLAITGGYP